MSNNLSRAVVQYAQQQQADFAYMVTGKWGSGKTHYWKSTIEVALQKELESPVVIYVSLHGVSDLRSIGLDILTQVHPRLRGKGGRLVTSIGHKMMKWLNVDQLIDESDFQTVLDTLANDERVVLICFDDLERAKLETEEVLGFINQFVEHGGSKAVILCNECEIVDQNAYRRIKEKTVGVTWKFCADQRPVIESIIDRFKSNALYHQYLRSHIDLITELFVAGKHDNFRALNNALLLLESAYEGFKACTTDPADDLVVSIVPMAIELQCGNQTEARIHALVTEGAYGIIASRSLSGNQAEGDAPISDTYKQLNDPDKFRGSPAVANLITTGYLDRDLLRSEIEHRKVPESILEKAIQSIAGGATELEEDAFLEVRDNVLRAIRDGKIEDWKETVAVASGFAFALDAGFLRLDEQDVKDAFQQGIRQQVANDTFSIPDPKSMTIQLNRRPEAPPLVHWVCELLQTTSAELAKEKVKSRLQDLLDAFPERGSDLAEFLCSPEEDGLFRRKLENLIDAQDFAKRFVEAPNHTKSLISSAFRIRYSDRTLHGDHLRKSDLAWIRQFKDALRLLVGHEQDHSIAKHLIEETLKALEMVCSQNGAGEGSSDTENKSKE